MIVQESLTSCIPDSMSDDEESSDGIGVNYNCCYVPEYGKHSKKSSDDVIIKKEMTIRERFPKTRHLVSNASEHKDIIDDCDSYEDNASDNEEGKDRNEDGKEDEHLKVEHLKVEDEGNATDNDNADEDNEYNADEEYARPYYNHTKQNKECTVRQPLRMSLRNEDVEKRNRISPRHARCGTMVLYEGTGTTTVPVVPFNCSCLHTKYVSQWSGYDSGVASDMSSPDNSPVGDMPTSSNVCFNHCDGKVVSSQVRV